MAQRQRHQQVRLGGEVVVDRRRRGQGLFRDRLDMRALIATLAEQKRRRIQNLLGLAACSALSGRPAPSRFFRK